MATNVLYKRAAVWGMPSHSPACIQAEALVRFSGADFRVVVQTEPGTSPTGFHPAFEKDQHLAGTDQCLTEFDCVRRIYQFLKTTHYDVDSQLTHFQSAMAQATIAFIQQNLEPATLYTAWCEKEGFKHYRKAYGGKLPFPLDYIVTKTEQRRIAKIVSTEAPEKIYERACSALESLSYLLGEKQSYLFGDSPCSADAFVYGHLLFYRLAPVVTPTLKKKLEELTNLKAYVERITKNYFAESAPVLDAIGVIKDDDEEEMTSAWSTTVAGERSWSAKRLWDEVQKMDRSSRWWLGSATALLLLYSWFFPPFVLVVQQDGSFADDEDDDAD